MNVLKFMRSSALLKYMLWLVILSFIIWIFAFNRGGNQKSSKGFGQDYIVKVKNKTLPPLTLSLALQFQREKIRSMLGEEYVEQFMKDAPKNITSGLVDSLILSYLAEEYGLQTSESEVADSIVKAYNFQDPKTQYAMMLQSRGVTSQDFEALWQTDLTRRKVLSFVASRFVFGEADIENRYKDANSKFKTKVVVIRSKNFMKDVGEIQDSEAMAVYEKEKATLAIPERRTLKYLMISAPSIRAGIEIPENEIKAYYESHKDRFGDKSFDQVKAQVRNVMLFSDKTYETKIKEIFDGASAEFKNAGTEKEIMAVADKYKIQVSTLNNMEKEKPQPPFMTDQALADNVFKAKTNEWSDITEMPMGSVRFCVTDITAPRPATFNDVKDDIKSTLKSERVAVLAKKAAYELKASFKDAKSLDEDAKKRQFQVQDSNEIKVEDPLPLVGRDKKLARQIFDGAVNQVNGPFETREGYCLSLLLEKNPADMQKFKTEKAGFIEDQAQKEAQTYIDDYLSRKRQELDAKGQIIINKDVLSKYEAQKGS
jgi:peptidyl-prolyl cis-trans isomerase D